MQKTNNPIRNIPSWDKPREKLLAKGAASLSDKELLTILIASGTPEHSAMDLAGMILESNLSNLGELSSFTPEEFMCHRGIGKAKACHLAAALELGRRIADSQAVQRLNVQSVDTLAGIFQNDLNYQCKETVEIALLDAKSQLISREKVSIGGLANSSAHPREIFAPAIRKGAAAIVLAHNHPSGDCEPSAEDMVITKNIVESGKLLGIHLVDHLIIGHGEKYYSFLEHNPDMFR